MEPSLQDNQNAKAFYLSVYTTSRACSLVRIGREASEVHLEIPRGLGFESPQAHIPGIYLLQFKESSHLDIMLYILR